jgi:uncharacterized membrane protein HdeD (DUF308 family)
MKETEVKQGNYETDQKETSKKITGILIILASIVWIITNALKKDLLMIFVGVCLMVAGISYLIPKKKE